MFSLNTVKTEFFRDRDLRSSNTFIWRVLCIEPTIFVFFMILSKCIYYLIVISLFDFMDKKFKILMKNNDFQKIDFICPSLKIVVNILFSFIFNKLFGIFLEKPLKRSLYRKIYLYTLNRKNIEEISPKILDKRYLINMEKITEINNQMVNFSVDFIEQFEDSIFLIYFISSVIYSLKKDQMKKNLDKIFFTLRVLNFIADILFMHDDHKQIKEYLFFINQSKITDN